MTSALLTVVLVINELMASNLGIVMSPATNFDSWIELYNPTETAIELSGMYLSDNSENLKLWQMPTEMGSVPAHGYKVVWLGSNNIKSDQAPFHLNCDGGTIYLSDTEGNMVTSMTYPKAMSRTAYARTSDGGDEWGWTAYPTPGASNSTSAFANERLAPPTVNLDSKLFTGTLNVKVDIPDGAVLMYTTDGSVPTKVAEEQESPDTWKEWVKNGDCEGDDASCLIGKNGDEGGVLTTHFADGEGYNGSRCVKVHAVSNPTYSWDSQFFVYTPNHTLLANAKYTFKMKVRADKNATITVQSHTSPGNYIHWTMLAGSYNVTTKWQEIKFEGTVTNEQAGMGGLSAIAFNLNELQADNNYYFDDISWESAVGTGNSNTSQQSKDGQFTITKTTNLCCRLFKDGYLPSVPVTRSYIQSSTDYTIPVISIVGDQRYFTDQMWGIDVQGSNGISGNGSDTPCNWNMDWDRPVNFSYITPDGEMAFNQDVNICVSGGWTRGASPRSFKLKSSKEFDGLNDLDYMFFPQKPYIRNKVLLVRNGGNDTWENNSSRFMDPGLQGIVQRSGIDMDLQSYLPVIEFVNGEFRGVLNLREPNNKKFVASNHGYDDDNLDMLENFWFVNGTSDVLDRIFELGRRINDSGAYDELKELLDIDEFTNYMAIELFLGSTDWPHNNVKAYRSREDGRYRFVLFDLDFAFKSDDPFRYFQDHQTNTTYSEASYMDFCKFFINLLGNAEYRKKFIDTYCLIAGSVFEKDRSYAIIDELADHVRPMQRLDGNRSPDPSANKIKEQLATRLTRMMDCMQDFAPMQLSGAIRQKVELSTDTEGGRLQVNGIEVPYSSFIGELFQPIELSALTPAGYTFAGWKKTSTSVDLISSGGSWKYYDKGALSGTTWRSRTFNDSSWSSGAAPLGYKMTGVKTTVSYGSNSNSKNPTTYFRTSFNFSGTPTSKDQFMLHYNVDDGFVIYVNGSELTRVNMPNGSINYNTFSSSYAGDVPLTGSIEIPYTLIRNGANVIAVEVHNNSATSSDLYWDARLEVFKSTDSDSYYSTDAVIEMPTDSRLSLVACFTPLTEEEQEARHIHPVCINEVSASNGIYVNEYWKRNDWIELYNTTDTDIDVEGMYLSDNVDKPKKWQISNDGKDITTVIPPFGHLIIWCDKLDSETQLHAPFKLAAEGGDVILTSSDERWTDQLHYEAHLADETVGRYPDGNADVYVMNVPTIAKANLISSYVSPIEQPYATGISDMAYEQHDGLTIRSSSNGLIIESTSSAVVDLRIVTMAGQLVSEERIALQNGYGKAQTGNLQSGIYVASVSDGQGNKASCKFMK